MTNTSTASNILSRLSVAKTYIELTFRQTPQVSSLVNEHFRLYRLNDSEGGELEEPEHVSDPFQQIVPANHYNSISRRLVLHLSTGLEQGRYRLVVDGVKTATGAPMSENPEGYKPGEFDFDYEYTTSTSDPLPEQPEEEPLHVRDFSIKNAFVSHETITAANPDFHIVRTDPENQAVFLEEDHNRGRVVVRFSQRPRLTYINSSYIKVQKKRIGMPVSRWDTINTKLKLDSTSPILYIYIPAVYDTDGEKVDGEVYDEFGYTYFESGHKYRVRLLGDIAF